MGSSRKCSLTLPLLFFSFVFSFLFRNAALAERTSYVVYFGGHSHGSEGISLQSEQRTQDSHYEFLGSVLGSEEKARDAIFYSYTKYINGFAATLEEEEALEISNHPNVISVFPNRGHKLHTTRSWNFLGLERDNGRVSPKSIWAKSNFGEDVIIGNLDTGVWPEAESFRDEGMGPVPTQWKGICQNQFDSDIRCNRKLIGVRYFNKGYVSSITESKTNTNTSANIDSPRDLDGHGTHTLSTAAGRFVPSANLFGYGNGTAKGGAPNARTAAYKVCWPPVNGSECFDADILAAFDAAIHDGVHVLSVSLGSGPADYFKDGVAIGSFHAVKNGITVVCSAGNSGPDSGSVSNVAPWIITVGASTIDREFPAFLSVDNTKMHIKGQSLSPMGLPDNKDYPLISSVDAKASYASREDSKLCIGGTLDPAKTKGKIIVCIRGRNGRVEKGEAVRRAGGFGMVLANDEATGNELIADAHVLPATHISYSDGLSLLSYLSSPRSTLGYITLPETRLGTKPSPFMAAFSSQGPNTVNPEILKPDITAPGVSILAAYTGATGPSGLSFDDRRVLFNSESGTSMSCPHVAGIAGLLKSLHPDWSPSAIRSAIMTTARVQDNMRHAITNSSFLKATPFSYGSGHINPNRAMDPGLVYDLDPTDYLNFLCRLGYNSTQMATFSTDPYKCPKISSSIENLNYPSITNPNLRNRAEIVRRVKNVGVPSNYTVKINQPKGVSVSVEPQRLEFSKMGEEREFKVVLKVKNGYLGGDYVFGRLTWSDGKHYVRSPIVVKTIGHKP